ncbi:MAG: zinc ribbon domain-containing protein [Fidelibacterota bacterium]
MNRYKEQLYLVTTNKEYDALQKEMDNTRETINSHENILLELEDEKVNLEETIKRNTISYEELSKTLEKNQIELDNALAETIDEENRLTPIREDLAGTIERSYLFTYNRFREARGGKGIISVTRNACGLCYNHLPPQMIVEIRQNDKFVNCPNCGIYLYWEDESL